MIFVWYIIIQLLDFLTTVIGFQYGGQEANPIYRHLIQITPSPIAIVAYIKLGASLIGAILYNNGFHRQLYILNCMFGLVVTWNLFILAVLLLIRR